MLSVDYDDRLVAKCYVELGHVTKEKGEYDESLRYHRKSLEIFERIDDPLSVADSHLDIADVYKAKGELKRAMCEYEKGLTLYEDVFLEDSKKDSETGTDASLNSSYMSDLQHAKSLSKSEEILSRSTGLIEEPTVEIEAFEPCEDLPNSSSPVVVVATDDEKEVTKIVEPSNDSQRFPRWLIGLLLLLCLTGAFLWSISDSAILPFSTTQFNASSNDELSAQLRKFLLWRSDRWSALSKSNRRLIEEFLRQSDTRAKISLDKFQRLLELLDLKMILIPR